VEALPQTDLAMGNPVVIEEPLDESSEAALEFGVPETETGDRRERSDFLVVSNLETPFVSIDLEILKSRYAATLLVARRGILGVIEVVRRSLKASAGLGWFASWHTFPAALSFGIMRKPFLLIIGGYDLAKMPEIDYGHQRGGLKKWLARSTMWLATRLMTNSEYSRQEAVENAGLDGYPIAVVYHGVRDLFGSLPNKGDSPLVVTVGNVDRANLYRKGHEPFVRAAALLPDVEFRLVGSWRDDAIEYLRSIATPNVVFAGRVSDDELRETLANATVYVQASAHEGFGMSLAESMLAGCVPVVSERGAIPEVVGSAGIYLSDVSPRSLTDGIQLGLKQSGKLGPRARNRIIENFPLEIRRDGLLNEVAKLRDSPEIVL
jgi:glycosyltransferase involved in cell wall biosynthesis